MQSPRGHTGHAEGFLRADATQMCGASCLYLRVCSLRARSTWGAELGHGLPGAAPAHLVEGGRGRAAAAALSQDRGDSSRRSARRSTGLSLLLGLGLGSVAAHGAAMELPLA